MGAVGKDVPDNQVKRAAHRLSSGNAPRVVRLIIECVRLQINLAGPKGGEDIHRYHTRQSCSV